MEITPVSTILMPVDFSVTSLTALAHAEELAHRYQAKLLLLYVVESVVAPMEFNAAAIIEVNRIEHADKRLEQLCRNEIRNDLDVATEITEGEPALAIVRVAQQERADLIVMGTHGHSGFRHLVLGSRAERVVRQAGCPVLTVGPGGC
ncbi:MAG: universal stress protein [Immundisolibacteraceae bacterium]|nr:universal stress protein [Immundisolibacteraceae bacterium]